MKLSIGMMVKNEEKNLEKCLQSLEPLLQEVSSELIIVDTGSEDNTVQIARKYTEKVYFHPWNDDFAAMRNITISYAKGEWFFVIDGDEVLENPRGIINFMNSNKNTKYNSGIVLIKNYLSENDKLNTAIAFTPRLFRRDKDFCYRGKIHNQPIYKGPTAEIKATLLHYGYINTDKELMEKKFVRTSALLKSELEKDPENIYYWFQLSQSYSMHKDYKEALEAILKAYCLVKKKKLNIKKYMYVLAQLAKNYWQNQKYMEAEDICKEALKINDEYFDFYYYLGIVQSVMWKNEEAIANFQSYLKKAKKFEHAQEGRDLSMMYYSVGEVERVYSTLALLYKRQDEHEKALEFLEKIKSGAILKDISSNHFFNYIDACLKLKSYARIKDYYDRVVSPQEKDVGDLFFAALEKSLLNMPPEDKKIVQELFAGGESDYALLQKVRLAIAESINIDDKLDTRIRELDFNNLPEYYGDVIYYCLKNDFPVTTVLQKVRERKIDSFLNYLKNVYEDLTSILFRYLKKQKGAGTAGETLAELLINKTFAKYLLVLDKLEEEQYEYIFNRYIEDGGKYLRSIYKEDIVQKEQNAAVKDAEDGFLLYMSLAEENKGLDKVKYLRYLRKALKEYPLLKRGIEIQLKRVKENVENVKADALSYSRQDSVANSELELYKRQVKDNLQKLINAGRVQEAREIIQQYESLVTGDAEIYSMKGVLAVVENNLEEAEKILREGLEIDNQNFDLLYNLAYVYEQAQRYQEAYYCYNRAKNVCREKDLVDEIEKKLEDLFLTEKTKIAFFVKHNLDSFLDEIINELSKEYDTVKITIKTNEDLRRLDKWMDWADICWFEWCDELIIYGSRLARAQEKKIICRLHSYEAFTSYPSQVNWDNVDKLIFVAEHIQKYVLEKNKINKEKTIIIPNGVDVNNWTFNQRTAGYKIAYAGYINYKKGPMLLLHTFKAIYDLDHRYKLYIAGQFQDDRDSLYFHQMIKEFGLENNFFFEGWQVDLDGWMEDKNYILCTSVLESQNMSVMQAMAKGIKPIVHNFTGAKGIYPQKYLWNTIDEAVRMVTEKSYDSREYRGFIENNYSFVKQLKEIQIMLGNLITRDKTSTNRS